MSLAKLLPIVVPQLGIPNNIMTPCDVIMEHKGSMHNMISTRDQGYGDHVKTIHSTALRLRSYQ